MFRKNSTGYGEVFKQNSLFQKVLRKVLLIAIVVVIISLIPVVYFQLRRQDSNERRELRQSFESGAFEISHRLSGEMLKENPLDFTLLSIHGFSAYELAISQINSFDTLAFVDESIWSLRRALLVRENSPELHYVLGKSYFYKGPAYADLAIKYLGKARASFDAADIPEYLGLSYAAIGDYRSSVAAFAFALIEEPSDLLLLSIARSYFALEEYEQARAYLIRCLETSRDSRTVSAARLLLASAFAQMGDIPAAEAEYLKLIEESGENAEAHYQLGVLYFSAGDATRARAEWRRALRIDPAYSPARRRLNL